MREIYLTIIFVFLLFRIVWQEHCRKVLYIKYMYISIINSFDMYMAITPCPAVLYTQSNGV